MHTYVLNIHVHLTRGRATSRHKFLKKGDEPPIFTKTIRIYILNLKIRRGAVRWPARKQLTAELYSLLCSNHPTSLYILASVYSGLHLAAFEPASFDFLLISYASEYPIYSFTRVRSGRSLGTGSLW